MPRRGAGSIVEDVDGNLFLDINAGIAVTSTGHCHPRVVEAIQRQASQLLHYSASDFYLPIYAEVAERLAALAPFGGAPARVFLSNSGTEAVEAAIKLARHADRSPVPDRLLRVVPRAFDGLGHAHGIEGEVPRALRADAAQRLPLVLRRLRLHRAGAVPSASSRPGRSRRSSWSPGSARAGTCSRPKGWFRYLRDLCDRHGILLVCDEVQSGAGRSGTMWAIEQEGVTPDIITAGKGIASGLPLGAMIARDEVMTWEPGAHGSTYGGSPVPCAAALATLDVIEDEGLMTNASAVG